MAHPYLKEIKKIFASNANAVVAKGAKAYLLNQFEFYGIKTPLRRKLSKEFYKSHPIANHNEISIVVKECFEEPQRELHYFAIELLGYHKKLWSIKTLPSSIIDLECLISLFISYWPPSMTMDAVSATIVAGERARIQLKI